MGRRGDEIRISDNLRDAVGPGLRVQHKCAGGRHRRENGCHLLGPILAAINNDARKNTFHALRVRGGFGFPLLWRLELKQLLEGLFELGRLVRVRLRLLTFLGPSEIIRVAGRSLAVSRE
jgi:hypothetical protein